MNVTHDNGEVVPTTVNLLGTGDSFGEVALLRNLQRNASVITTEPTEVLTLTRAHYLRTIQRFEMSNLDTKINRITKTRPFNTMATGVPGCPLRKLAEVARDRHLDSNQVVVKQGEPADELFMIETGILHVMQKVAFKGKRVEVRIATLTPGDFFGEHSLLNGPNGTTPASVVCSTFVHLLVINKRQFDHRCLRPPLRKAIADAAVRYPKDESLYMRLQDHDKVRRESCGGSGALLWGYTTLSTRCFLTHSHHSLTDSLTD